MLANLGRISKPFDRARRKFLKLFPRRFHDETMAWERDYKWEAHREWELFLNADALAEALHMEHFQEIAMRAVRIESGRSRLFSFEKMALRDAVRSNAGAKIFAEGLYQYLHGKKPLEQRFVDWISAIECLPRKQTLS